MSRKKKLEHFADLLNYSHFFQPSYEVLMQEGFPLKSKWNSDFFEKNQPIILELGCGKGDYTVGLAQRFPQFNYIGMDRKGARLWRGTKDSHDIGMDNVAFIRGQVFHIDHYFGADEVQQIWITFPDPQLQSPKVRKRLTHPSYLEKYRNILTKNHLIHLKTDNDTFYQYTLEVIREQGHELLFANDNIYNSALPADIEEQVCSIKTFYEQMWLQEGRTIKYLQFRLK
ncbi:MAG: tRNA (guanosine(46)-N7)-methyltransferase TrmB [Bacteroidales bacterium]|nr:tRNA (guanosine(46)-N7)-methyltransferase TrmB [Bacteroidales bacterium]